MESKEMFLFLDVLIVSQLNGSWWSNKFWIATAKYIHFAAYSRYIQSIQRHISASVTELQFFFLSLSRWNRTNNFYALAEVGQQRVLIMLWIWRWNIAAVINTSKFLAVRGDCLYLSSTQNEKKSIPIHSNESF